MNDIIWQSLPYLNLLWVIVPVIALFAYASWRNRVLLARFAHQTHAAALTRAVNRPARFMKRLLYLLAIAAIAVALARPAWNKSSQPFQAKGRDVVFILDISRSMLATHRNTTRLEEAKFAIQECLSTIRGDRVALIIFAGNAKIACPLTHDTSFFLSKLNDVDYRSVTFGGTMLGDAIRLAVNGIFKNRAELYRDVIVITDGEDMQSNPIQAAEQLADIDARLIAVGMGDDTPTPLIINTPDGGTETITDNGSPIMTKLDSDTLLRMAEATPGGLFIPVHSDTLLNLNDIYKKNIESQLKRDFESHDIVTYEEKFQIFLATAMLLILIARLLPDTVKTLPQRAALLLAILFTTIMQPTAKATESSSVSSHLQPISPNQQIVSTNQQIDNNDINKNEYKRIKLEEAAAMAPQSPYPVFNLGVLDYLEENYEDAIEHFSKALVLTKNQKTVNKKMLEACYLAIASSEYKLSGQETNRHPVNVAKDAVNHFKDALKINPKNTTTHNNLNLAKTNYKTLRRKQQEQQQQQQGDGKNDDKKDDSQEQNDQQKQQKQQGQQDKQEQQQNQQQQDGQNDQQQQLKQLEQEQRQAADDMNNSEKSQQDLQQQQKDLEQKSQQAAQQQQAKEEKNEKAENFLKEAAAKQQEAKEHLEKNEKEQAQQAQKDAADMTQMARQALQEQPQEQQKQDEKQQEQQAQEQQAQQAQEQPPKDNDTRAQDAINLENLNKQNRQKYQITAPAMQNKDW